MRLELGYFACTVEPRYNKDLGTMKITGFNRFLISQGKKQRNIKSLNQQYYLVIRGFCYISNLFIARFHCSLISGLNDSAVTSNKMRNMADLSSMPTIQLTALVCNTVEPRYKEVGYNKTLS